LDNGFVSCDDHDRLQAICDQLGPEQIDGLARRWLARLPHPFTPQDREAGYRYDLSILQAEFSLTQILDRPLSDGKVAGVVDGGFGAGAHFAHLRNLLEILLDARVLVVDYAERESPRRSAHGSGIVPACAWSPAGRRSVAPCRGGRDRDSHGQFPTASVPANGCVTCRHCGRSAFPPTDVFSKSNASARTAPSEKKRC